MTQASRGLGYQVNIYMTKPFTVSAPTVYSDTSEPGWTVGSYVPTAVSDGSG